MSQFQIDDIDRIILTSLSADARTPYLEIARECGISGAAIHQRVHKLEENGVITGSRLLVKPTALGLGVCVYINIALSESGKYQDVINHLQKIPEVVECHFVTGKYALLVKAYCQNNEELINIIIKDFQNIPFIESTETMVVLDTAFDRSIIVNRQKK